MTNEIKIVIKKLKSLLPSRYSNITIESTTFGWFPVLELKGKFSLGITELGYWGVQAGERFILLDEESKFGFVVAFLEIPYAEIVQLLDKVEDEIDLVSIFPFKEIIAAGLDYKSDHWVKCSLDWFDKLKTIEKLNLKDNLMEIVQSKYLSQKNRQKASSYLNRL